MPTATPVLLVTGTDAVDVEVAAGSVLCDLPRAVGVALRFRERDERLGWRSYDHGGVRARGVAAVGADCRDCLVRRLLVDTLLRSARGRDCEAIVATLPAGCTALPCAVDLARGERDGVPLRRVLDLRSILAVVSARDTQDAVFGVPATESCDPATEPTPAESLVAQVEFADAVALAHPAGGPDGDPADSDLLAHLLRPGTPVCPELCDLPLPRLLGRQHDLDAALAYVEPCTRRATGAADTEAVSTVEIQSWKPMHPERLLERLDVLGLSGARVRGGLWLPGRPGTVVAIDAVAGQVRLGDAGRWGGHPRRTRLVATTPTRYAEQVRTAFADAVMTDAEALAAHSAWAGRPDGFEPWLARPRPHPEHP